MTPPCRTSNHVEQYIFTEGKRFRNEIYMDNVNLEENTCNQLNISMQSHSISGYHLDPKITTLLCWIFQIAQSYKITITCRNHLSIS